MKIGVTGCAGFLGSHLVDTLLARGYEVLGIDNLSMGKMENIAHNLDHPGFTFQKIDVRELELIPLLRSVDIIVHLAAYKIPRYGNASQTLLVNSQGIQHVLEAAAETKAKVVLASTSDVYGKSADIPFHEEGALVFGPSTVARWSYAVSKLYGEHLCFAYQEAFQTPVVIIRVFGSYGPRQHLSWWGGPQSVFISQILRREEITIHGDGQQTRSFTYVSDTVNGFLAAIESENAPGHIFNIGNTQEISIVELATLIKKLCQIPGELNVKFVPYSSFSGGKYEDVRRRIPDITKAQQLLHFFPRVSLEEGLSKTIEWQKRVLDSAS